MFLTHDILNTSILTFAITIVKSYALRCDIIYRFSGLVANIYAHIRINARLDKRREKDNIHGQRLMTAAYDSCYLNILETRLWSIRSSDGEAYVCVCVCVHSHIYIPCTIVCASCDE